VNIDSPKVSAVKDPSAAIPFSQSLIPLIHPLRLGPLALTISHAKKLRIKKAPDFQGLLPEPKGPFIILVLLYANAEDSPGWNREVSYLLGRGPKH
jgi:hypothetical protein